MHISTVDSTIDRSKHPFYSFMRKSIDSNDIFMKRQTPLSALTMTRSSTSSSTPQPAVLPRRKRKEFAAERPPKRFCHFVANQEPIGSTQQSKRGKSSKGSDDDISSEKIFQQLNVLKRGGYWKHLILEDMQAEFDDQDEEISEYGETPKHFRRKENKENVPQTSHPNTRSSHTNSHGRTDYEEEEDSREEEEPHHHNDLGSFVGSVITSDSKDDTIGVSFRVYAITEEGWMCGLERKEESKFLLHLPPKVAALGKQGMLVTGVDLMKRRDNGILEPCTHFRPSNPSTNATNDLLFGSISYS